MELRQGMKVKHKYLIGVTGVIANKFCPEHFPSSWTVILTNQNPHDPDREIGWFWNSEESWLNGYITRDNPLHQIRAGKYVYIFDEEDLTPCCTKLGNEL